MSKFQLIYADKRAPKGRTCTQILTIKSYFYYAVLVIGYTASIYNERNKGMVPHTYCIKLVVCVLYIANQCRLFNTNVNICQECIWLINQIAVSTTYRAMLCKITSKKGPTFSLHLQISNLILLCNTWFIEPSDARLRRQTLPLLAQIMTACRVGGMDRNFTLCIPCATTL